MVEYRGANLGSVRFLDKSGTGSLRFLQSKTATEPSILVLVLKLLVRFIYVRFRLQNRLK